MAQRPVESIAEKSKRLVSIAGGDGRVPAPPPRFDPGQGGYGRYAAGPPPPPPRRRSPTRLAAAAAAAPISAAPPPRRAMVPQHTPAQLQAFVNNEQQRAQTEAEAMQRQMSMQAPAPQGPAPTSQGMAALRGFTQAAPAPEPEPDPPVHVSATESKLVSQLSTWDQEVLEMAEQLDPGQLVMDGFVAVELEVHEALSASVRSFKKSDWTAINQDVNEFRRGLEVQKEVSDPEDPSKTRTVTEILVPFPDEILEFAKLRQLAQGILGVNGAAYPENWTARANLLEDLAFPVYDAILREFTKFLQAAGTLFPDKPTQEKMEQLKANLGKAQAHP